MKVLKKRVTRLLFVIYIYNKEYFDFSDNNEILWQNCLNSYELTNMDLDLDFLYKLQNQKIDYDIDFSSMDLITTCIIKGGLTELLFFNEPKLIISEAMKLADLLNVNSKYINGFLDNYIKSK